MSMYADYLKERTSDSIIESDYGFATYRITNSGKSVYIIDIYVIPEMRKSQVASNLADQVCGLAKGLGCVELLGTVVPSARSATASIRVLLGYGMHLQSAANDLIVFRKDI